MSRSPGPASLIRFGVFELDLETGELRRHGLKVKLRDQSFQVLSLLLEHPGQLVTREQLQRKLWAGNTFVDFDRGLNKAINRLRDALGDSAESPGFIETLPKRGYRFIGSIEDTGIGGNALLDVKIQMEDVCDTSERGLQLEEARARPRITTWPYATAATVIFLIAGAIWWQRFSVALPPPSQPVPLTSYQLTVGKNCAFFAEAGADLAQWRGLGG